MNQTPIIFLQDALMQDWEGSAQNLATTNNLKFQEKKKKTAATNKNRTDGEAVSQEKKLKSLWVCFDRQQEGLRQRRRWQKRNNVNLSNSAVKLLQEKKKILSISGEWLLHLLLNWTLSVVLPLQLTLKLTLKKTPRFPVPIPAG